MHIRNLTNDTKEHMKRHAFACTLHNQHSATTNNEHSGEKCKKDRNGGFWLSERERKEKIENNYSATRANRLNIPIKFVQIEHMTPAAMQCTSPISSHDNLIKV